MRVPQTSVLGTDGEGGVRSLDNLGGNLGGVTENRGCL